MDAVQEAVDRWYKSHYGIMVSTLLHHFKEISLETIEDVVQDSLAAALTGWARDGIPANPAGWIYVVSRNKLLDKIREGRKTRPLFDDEDFDAPEPEFKESAFDDRVLALLFACAHPDLPPKVQVVITLKYVVNLTIGAIAKALAMTTDGVDKLLFRARQKIREENILLIEPHWGHLAYRLPIVNKIIYLIFNEGYKASSGKEIVKAALCGEALMLNKALLDKRVGDAATAALQALMLFNAARLNGRFGPSGELLDLEEQDRRSWDQTLISLGADFLEQSKGGAISTYHYEASIAYLHCIAGSFQSTDWGLISNLYGQLLAMNPNPFVELNYAIALYYAGEKEKAFGLLGALQENQYLHGYYLLNATLGKFYLLEGRPAKAREYLIRTLGQTDLPIEKDFIRKMMERLPGGG